MSNIRFLFLVVLMLAGLVAGTSLAVRPSTRVGLRRMLFTVTVLGALMPFAIHGLQIYESLTTVSSDAGLAIGLYPTLDRWIVSLLVLIVLLAVAGWIAARTSPRTAVAIPVVMAIAYLFGFLPYALRNRPAGTSPSNLPTSWLILALLIGVALIAAAARRSVRST